MWSQAQIVAQKDINCTEDDSDDMDDILTVSTIEINTMENTFKNTREEALMLLEINQPEKKQNINL